MSPVETEYVQGKYTVGGSALVPSVARTHARGNKRDASRSGCRQGKAGVSGEENEAWLS